MRTLLNALVQVAAAHHLREVTQKEVAGRAKLGVAAFAEALLGVPKTLAENSGFDAQVRRSAAFARPAACLDARAAMCTSMQVKQQRERQSLGAVRRQLCRAAAHAKKQSISCSPHDSHTPVAAACPVLFQHDLTS